MQFVYEKMLVVLKSEADPRFFRGEGGVFKKVLKIFSIFFQVKKLIFQALPNHNKDPILANVSLKRKQGKRCFKTLFGRC